MEKQQQQRRKGKTNENDYIDDDKQLKKIKKNKKTISKPTNSLEKCFFNFIQFFCVASQKLSRKSLGSGMHTICTKLCAKNIFKRVKISTIREKNIVKVKNEI